MKYIEEAIAIVAAILVVSAFYWVTTQVPNVDEKPKAIKQVKYQKMYWWNGPY